MRENRIELPVDEIIKLYTVDFLPAKVIGRMYNVDGDTIKRRLTQNNIPLRNRGDENYGKFREKKSKYPICEAEGCSNKATYHHNREVYCCDKHKYGLVIKNDINHISYYDRVNEVLHKDDKICILATYDWDGNISNKFIIDIFNLEKVQKYLWRANTSGYISKGKDENDKYDSLHRYLTDYKFKIVDHRNRNPLDNRMCNLREADNQGNSYNSTIGKNNNSGVIGVHYDKNRDKWKATIKINYKNTAIRFDNFDDAVRQRIIFESIHAKEFSPNYNIDTQTIQLTYHSHDDNKQTFIEVNLQGEITKFTKLPQ